MLCWTVWIFYPCRHSPSYLWASLCLCRTEISACPLPFIIYFWKPPRVNISVSCECAVREWVCVWGLLKCKHNAPRVLLWWHWNVKTMSGRENSKVMWTHINMMRISSWPVLCGKISKMSKIYRGSGARAFVWLIYRRVITGQLMTSAFRTK